MPVVSSAENHEITLDDGLARCRVWRRPDLSSEDGARCAEQMSSSLARLALVGSGARALALDLSEAPGVAGPRTAAAIGSLLVSWKNSKKRAALIVGDQPLKQLQMKRIVAENALGWAEVFPSFEQARTWLDAPPSSRR
ncbi:MAG: hypothetical protein U0165_11440 [Polyangiaceae bacterium]